MSIRTSRSSKRLVAALAAAGIAASSFAIASPASAAQVVTESRVFGADRYGTAANVALATFPAGATKNVILASGEDFADGLVAAGLSSAAKNLPGGANGAPILLTRSDSLPSVTANAIGTLTGGSGTVHIVGGTAVVSQAVRDQLTALGYTLNILAGDDRYETSALIAETAASLQPVGFFAGKRTAIVATGTGFADALAAGSPAFHGGHPILLTRPDSLPQSVSDALDTIAVTQVIVMGGTSAVSEAVELAIEAKGIAVIRVDGANRYETARNLADVLINPALDFNFYGAGNPNAEKEIVLVSGDSFADALAAGPHAGLIGAPMLLVRQCSIPEPTADFHVDNAATVDLVRAIGGPAAICEDVLDGAVAAASLVTPTATITAEQGRDFFTVTFSEAVTIASVLDGDFTFASIGRTLTESTITPLDPIAPANTAATTFRVLVDDPATMAVTDPLNTGDVINLVANTVQTPGTPVRNVAAATATVAADTTRPTAMISAFPTQPSFTVSFSEPVTSIDAADVTITTTSGTQNLGPGALIDAATNTYQFTPANPLVSGDVIRVIGTLVPPPGSNTGVLDLAGNPVISTQKIVAVDSVKPVLTSATQSTSVVTPATGTNGLVTFTARSTAGGAGALGNGWKIDFAHVDNAALTISVNGTTRVVTVGGDFVGDNITDPVATVSALILAWNSSAANDLIAIEAVSGPTLNGAADVTLAGGFTKVTIVNQFSEGVQGVIAADFGVFSDGTVFATPLPAFTIDPPLVGGVAFDGKVTLTLTTDEPLYIPVPGTAQVRIAVDAIRDLAGNGIANTAVTVTAAS